MPHRTLDVDGTSWRVMPSGHTTQSDADEFGVVFVRAVGADRTVRFSRFRPAAARSRDEAVVRLSDEALRALFAASQPGDTAPEAGYRL
jgi:hypothetical protein